MSAIENVDEFVSGLKVVELREELKRRNLSYAGNKSALAQRFKEFLQKEKEGEKGENGVPLTTEGSEAEVGTGAQQPVEGGSDAIEKQEACEEAGEEGDAAPEQEEYEEVMDQIVQTEASGETVGSQQIGEWALIRICPLTPHFLPSTNLTDSLETKRVYDLVRCP